jgi:hypothetical protein
LFPASLSGLELLAEAQVSTPHSATVIVSNDNRSDSPFAPMLPVLALQAMQDQEPGINASDRS